MIPDKRFVAVNADVPKLKKALAVLETMHGDSPRRFKTGETEALGIAVDLIEDILAEDQRMAEMEQEGEL